MKQTMITPDMCSATRVAVPHPRRARSMPSTSTTAARVNDPLSCAGGKNLDSEALPGPQPAYADYKTRTDHPVDPTTLSTKT
jgi:hypothetical protein